MLLADGAGRNRTETSGSGAVHIVPQWNPLRFAEDSPPCTTCPVAGECWGGRGTVPGGSAAAGVHERQPDNPDADADRIQPGEIHETMDVILAISKRDLSYPGKPFGSPPGIPIGEGPVAEADRLVPRP